MISHFPAPPLINFSGYYEFQFAPYYTIQSVPAAVNKLISNPILFNAPHAFLNGYATCETLDFLEPAERTPHGTIYKPTVAGFAPGDSDELAMLMEEMENSGNRYVVVITPQTGKKRIVGLNSPLKFTAELVPGKTPGGRKGYDFQFFTTATERAFFYNV